MSQKTANAIPDDNVYVPNKTADASDYSGTTYQGDEFLSDEVIRDLRDYDRTFSSRKERGAWKIQKAVELLEEAKEDLGDKLSEELVKELYDFVIKHDPSSDNRKMWKEKESSELNDD